MFEFPLFQDRADGGRQLAVALAKFRGTECVVYGLPRGGVITAKAVADALGAPLDLVITRKLSHPYSPEYGIGAVTEEGQTVLNPIETRDLPGGYLEQETARRLQEARARHRKYLQDRAPVPVEGKTAIIVDDGIATGYTMKAAILSVRRRKPAKVVVAAPLASADVFDDFRGLADEVVVPNTPEDFFAIGTFYRDFAPVQDEEVVAAMREQVGT